MGGGGGLGGPGVNITPPRPMATEDCRRIWGLSGKTSKSYGWMLLFQNCCRIWGPSGKTAKSYFTPY